MADNTSRRRFIQLAGSAGVVALAGCAGGDDTGSGTDGPMDTPEGTETMDGMGTATESGGGMAATTVTVTVENVASGGLSTPEGSVPLPLSPGAYAAHTTDIQLFAPGEAASEGIERIAEDGQPTALVEAVGGADAVLDGGAFTTPDGADGPGPLTPGNTYSFEVAVRPDEDPRLSLATMFIQSNDLFYAPADPAGIPLFEGGEPRSGSVAGEFALWDAGTEVNERPGVGPNQAPRQMEADTGTPEGVVRRVNDAYDYPDTADVLRLSLSVAEQGMSGATWDVTLENVSMGALPTPDGSVPVPLSPGVYAAHTTDIQLFTPGETASEGLERLAEDGRAGPLAEAVGGADAVLDGGAFSTPDGSMEMGPLFPGDSYSFQVSADASDDPRLSVATMFVQSNDLFYAPADPAGIPLFEGGAPVEGELTAELALWDAGTEVNERPGVGPNQAPRQMEADTGTPEGVVRRVMDGYDYPDTADVLDVRLAPEMG